MKTQARKSTTKPRAKVARKKVTRVRPVVRSATKKSAAKANGAAKHEYYIPISSGLAKMWFNEEEDKAWEHLQSK